MICRNCKEEINEVCNSSDFEDVCFSCLQRIVEDYFEHREEENPCHICEVKEF